MTIKTYRGLLPNGGQEKIRLKTMTGSIGYKIKKFQIITAEPGNATQDLVMKIYTSEQASVPTSAATIDFSDNSLIAVAHYSQAVAYYNQDVSVIFENEIFNQDIYVTSTDNDGADPCNFYLELEVVKLRDSENDFVTLKDIKATLPQHG